MAKTKSRGAVIEFDDAPVRDLNDGLDGAAVQIAEVKIGELLETKAESNESVSVADIDVSMLTQDATGAIEVPAVESDASGDVTIAPIDAIEPATEMDEFYGKENVPVNGTDDYVQPLPDEPTEQVDAPTTVAEAQELVGIVKPAKKTKKTKAQEAEGAVTLTDIVKDEERTIGKRQRKVVQVIEATEDDLAARSLAFKAPKGMRLNMTSPDLGDVNMMTGFKNVLGQDSTDTHRHVNATWQERCKTFSEVRNEIGKADELKRDDDAVRLNQARIMQDDLGLIRCIDGRPFTGFGLQSYWDYLGLPMGMLNYFRQDESNGQYNDLIVRMVNDTIDKKSDDDKLALFRYRVIRALDGTEIEAIRAVRSSTYRKLDNDKFLMLLYTGIPGEGRADTLFSHLTHDGDNMIGNLLPPDHIKLSPDGDEGIGLSIRNSEVGLSQLEIRAFLFDAICYNGNIWSRKDAQSKFVVRHSGTEALNYDDLQKGVNTAIKLALTEGKSFRKQFNTTYDVAVEEPDQMIMFLAQENGLSQSQGRLWWESYETQLQLEATKRPVERTLGGVISALTRSGQKYTGFQRNAIEQLAGELTCESLTETKDGMKDRVKSWEKFSSKHTVEAVTKYFTGNLVATTTAPQNQMEQIVAVMS